MAKSISFYKQILQTSVMNRMVENNSNSLYEVYMQLMKDMEKEHNMLSYVEKEHLMKAYEQLKLEILLTEEEKQHL